MLHDLHFTVLIRNNIKDSVKCSDYSTFKSIIKDDVNLIPSDVH